MLGEHRHCLVGVYAHLANNEWHRSHYIFNECRGALNLKHKPHVAVGHDANQLAVLINHRQSRDSILSTEVIDLLDGGVGVGGDRV